MVTKSDLEALGFKYCQGWYSNQMCWNIAKHYNPSGFSDIIVIEFEYTEQRVESYTGFMSDPTYYPNCKTVEQIQQLINMF